MPDRTALARSLLAGALAFAAAGCAARGAGSTDVDVMSLPAGSSSASTTAAAAPAPSSTATTTVILVRHAERPPGGDPSLDDAGRARAESLAEVLASAGVTAIYTTQFRRTQETAAPLAQRLGITPRAIAVQSGQSADAHAAEVAAAIRGSHAGGVVLVVGHSNTVPLIVRALGGSAPAQLAETEYGNLFVVTLGEAGARTIRAKYGM